MYRNRKEVLKTLSYFDLFDFPPTKKEIFHFLGIKISQEQLEKELSGIKSKDDFYFLEKRGTLVMKRKRRDRESKEKIKKAVKTIKKISLIPTIKLVGLSGSLSMKNTEEDDDIDIFIVAKKGTVWLTRLLVVLSLIVLGVYRNKGSSKVKDKICLNLIIDERFNFAKSQRNLYVAHEIVQLLPIFERDDAYSSFIKKNKWVENYLPNFKERISKYSIPIRAKTTRRDEIFNKFFKVLYLEQLSKFIQYLYMKPKITTERVDKDVLAFHPKNYEEIVLKRAQIYTRGH